MRPTWGLLLLLVGPAILAGCVGGEESTDITAASAGPGARQRVDVAEGTGTVRGVVTDEAVQPVVGAEVTLVELNVTATTASTGTFEFVGVEPGPYTVSVRADGFVSAAQEVQVRSARTTPVDFILAKLAEELPFVQEFEMTGFITYGWGLGYNITPDAPMGLGGTWVRDNNCDYDQLAGPDCRGEFAMEPPLTSMVFEMVWAQDSPLAENMLAMMRVSDNAPVITGEWEIFSIEGPSPLYQRMDPEELDEVIERFAERCDNGEDEFCGLGFRDQGWPMQTRVWPGWQCPTDLVGFCAVLEQEYTQFVTAFYHQLAPEGYSIVDPS